LGRGGGGVGGFPGEADDGEDEGEIPGWAVAAARGNRSGVALIRDSYYCSLKAISLIATVMMMRAAILLMALMGSAGPAPDGPAMKPDPEYPIHVRVILTKANGGRRGYTGFGRGDILPSPSHEAPPQGFDFTYDCAVPFLANTGAGEFYQAQWKKPEKRLEILMQQIGSNHLDHCELQVALKAAPYGQYSAGAAK
jgi:hypothetical protein